MSANQIIPRLWMGSHPDTRRDFEKIDVWVPCAIELQPAPEMTIAGVHIFPCPLDDDGMEMEPSQERELRLVSREVAFLHQQGQNVLVTCAMGQNRSGLMTALILMRIYDADPDEVINLVRARRRDLPDGRMALANREFTSYLRRTHFRSNPFRSRAQWRACLAKGDPSWDCEEWASVSPAYEDLPERMRGNPKSNADVLQEWRQLVNMSARELRQFMDSDLGRRAGMSEAEARRAGVRRGRDSARAILRMKEKGVAQWNANDWEWARRQVAFIKRMRGVKGPLLDAKGNPTRKLTSLLIWGHNPL